MTKEKKLNFTGQGHTTPCEWNFIYQQNKDLLSSIKNIIFTCGTLSGILLIIKFNYMPVIMSAFNKWNKI